MKRWPASSPTAAVTSPLKLCVRRLETPVHSGLPVEVSLQVPSEVGWIEESVELLARHCFAGFDPPTRLLFRFRVALSEALANAIVCGNQEDPDKPVEVRAECHARYIRLHVSDQGCGFDPDQVPPPVGPADLENCCGRGLFLIRNLMDEVRFNEHGNSICMTLSRR